MHLIKLILRKITGKAEDTLVTLSVSFRVFLCIRSPSNSDTTVMGHGGRLGSPDAAYGKRALPGDGIHRPWITQPGKCNAFLSQRHG